MTYYLLINDIRNGADRTIITSKVATLVELKADYALFSIENPWCRVPEEALEEPGSITICQKKYTVSVMAAAFCL